MNTNKDVNEWDVETVFGIIRCPYCNATIYTDDAICRYCGEDLGTRFCSYCENEIPVYEDTCPFCGHLELDDDIVEVDEEEEARTNRVAFILGLAIILYELLFY
jgi:RNA polymerase subunit RPABC4/transcription elongation factor Spt4